MLSCDKLCMSRALRKWLQYLVLMLVLFATVLLGSDTHLQFVWCLKEKIIIQTFHIVWPRTKIFELSNSDHNLNPGLRDIHEC